MKIVNRLEFMKLPSGTLYRQAPCPFAFGDLEVKFDSMPFHENGDGDFGAMAFDAPENTGSEDLSQKLYAMLDDGASYPLELDGVGRDGLFDTDAIFLVYERDDVVRLRDFLSGLIEKSP